MGGGGRVGGVGGRETTGGSELVFFFTHSKVDAWTVPERFFSHKIMCSRGFGGISVSTAATKWERPNNYQSL